MNASDLFVKALKNEGVDTVFALPGEENLDLLEALRKSDIQHITTRHEQGAGFMAATHGRLTGKPGVVYATLGPGATNLVTPAAYAKLGGWPMVVVTGQKPIHKSKQARFQILDVVSLFKAVTKKAGAITTGRLVPREVREAFRIAQEGRPGPVQIEFPEDVSGESVDARLAHVFPVANTNRPQADAQSIDDAARLISSAKRPLLLVGAGANRREVSTALTEFVNKTGIPFFTTQMGKGVIDERHPLFIGTAALSDKDYVHCAVDQSDLVIAVGHDVIEKPPFFMAEGGKTVIHVNETAAEVDDIYFPQHEVVGDIDSSMRRLGEKIGKSPSHDTAFFQKSVESVHSHISEGADDPRFPLAPQRIVADVRKVMGDDDIIALDNGMYKIWFARNYPAYKPNTILLDNALATMGAGLPSAMEAARLNPNKRVMAICGDGGFMMNSQELETALRLKLNLVVLVVRDDGYGMIRWKQGAQGMPEYGLSFNNPDFVKYAESYGAHGHRVESADDFAPQMKRCFEEGGVHVIDVPVDYSNNKTVLNDELSHKTCPV